VAHAYTPGLMVTAKTIYLKDRRLPLKGDVTVKVGDRVRAEDVVARTELPGSVYPVNAAFKLSCPPKDVPEAILVSEGSQVTEGQVIGRSATFFGMFNHELRSPVTGTLESISRITGQIMLRAAPIPVELNAFIDGEVIGIIEDEGVTLSTPASFVQGIFGIGGEVQGELMMVASQPDQTLDESNLPPNVEGKVLVGGALVTLGAIRKAIELGAKALIAGGIHDQDLRELLDHDLGVAITGNENLGLTLVLTEGFGTIPMANRTFELLRDREGCKTSVCGATQIRAGVMRPEIVIPLDDQQSSVPTSEAKGYMEIGSSIRIIRQPRFGEIARVKSLPVELTMIESGASVRVVEVEFEDGKCSKLPRANVELIEF